MRARLDAWTREQILKLKEQGLSNAVIMQRLGVCHRSVAVYSHPENHIQKHEYGYRLTSPDGEIYETENLSKFARDHGLYSSGLYRIIKGSAKHYKGWTIEK